jgi:hypothetical protein
VEEKERERERGGVEEEREREEGAVFKLSFLCLLILRPIRGVRGE